MGRVVAALLMMALAGLGWIAQARAQGQSCLYEGRTYPEEATVCQAGLLQTCVNGEWQGGEPCDEEDAEDVGDEAPVDDD